MKSVETKTKPKPKKQIETQVQRPGDIAEQKVKQWLLNQSYTVKLACVILWAFTCGDHGTDKLANEIFDQFEKEIAAVANGELKTLKKDELFMTGVASELMIWRNHY